MIGRIALALGALLVALAVAEAAARLLLGPGRPLDADTVWLGQAVPAKAHDEPPLVQIGPFRFREDPFPPEAFEPGVTRLLFLGDSFTAGAGVRRRVDRFPERVEAMLNAEPGAGRVHVFNAGVGATEPKSWAGYLKVLLPRYRPHAVLAVFFLRDGTILPTSLRYNRAMIEPIQRRWESQPLYDVSALARFFYDRLAWKEYSERFLAQLTASYLGTPGQRGPWLFQQGFLREMAADCREAGVPFHLVLFPLLFDLDDYAFFGVEAEIERFARRAGIPVFSLTPGFLGHDAAGLWVASNDQHPNERGHRIAAETLAPYVRALVARLNEAAP